MTHSYRNTPICGITTCKSEKQDKRLANRKLRRVNKRLLNYGITFKSENIMLYNLKEVSNIWDFGKDGKQYLEISSYKYNGYLEYFKKLCRK